MTAPSFQADTPRPTAGDYETVVAADAVAAVAAYAAATTPGVVRLEAGVSGLLGDLTRSTWQRVAGIRPAPVTGTTVALDAGGAVRAHLDIAVDGHRQAAATASAVRRSVARAVNANTGLPVAAVIVSILDVDLAAPAGAGTPLAPSEPVDPTPPWATPEAEPTAAGSRSPGAYRPRAQLCDAVLAAARTVDGLRPAAPVLTQRRGWLPWDPGTLAVDVDDDRITVRLAATRLPLPPLLDQVAAGIREATADTRWAQVPHRLVVVALDVRAFGHR